MAKRQATPIPHITPEIEAAFLDCLYRNSNGCWLWKKSHCRRGYGRCVIRRREFKAHRISYAIFRGHVPTHLHVCHDCPGLDNPGCCNPMHLFLGTDTDNMRDASRKGRIRIPHYRGSENSRARLGADDVQFIRAVAAAFDERALGGHTVALAAQFKTTKSHVSKIVLRKVWSHI